MTNNINNNMNSFGAVNFGNTQKSKDHNAQKRAPIESEPLTASSLEALAAAKQAGIKGPYKYNPAETEKDIHEFRKFWAESADEILNTEFRKVCKHAFQKNYI